MTLPVTSLVNPPQNDNYQKVTAETFPEKYPFNFPDMLSGDDFWFKYYIS